MSICNPDEYLLLKVCKKCSDVFPDCNTCDMAATKCTSCKAGKALAYLGNKCVASCVLDDGGNVLSLSLDRCVKDCASEDNSILNVNKVQCVDKCGNDILDYEQKTCILASLGCPRENEYKAGAAID